MDGQLFGGIEAGGTKFKCAVGRANGEIVAQVQIPTTTTSETLSEVINFFKSQPSIEAVGVGSFGPLDLNSDSITYGFITSTPKSGWTNTDIVGKLSRALQVPVQIQTDIDCALLAEHKLGAGQDFRHVAYMTVGTGIGISYIVDSKLIRGSNNIELGHMYVPHDRSDQGFVGSCPYHKDCLEGLASGTALRARSGQSPSNIIDPRIWEMEARYLAYGVWNVFIAAGPERFILGGGVMKNQGLLEAIRKELPAIGNDYMSMPAMNDLLCDPSLGDMSGVTGAILIAAG